MASYTWPGSLPQKVRTDYTENAGVLILSTPMDAGPAKRRRRGNMPNTVNVGFYMTTAQVATLENFVQNTIKGTARFDFPQPRTGGTVEVRLVPQGDGRLYSVSYYSPTEWLVDMNLEIIP
jgi:hypothetical protein